MLSLTLIGITILKSLGALNVLHVEVLTCVLCVLQHQATQRSSISATPPASAASNGGAQPPAETAGASCNADRQLPDTHDQAVDSRAAVRPPPVQHALPPLIQQLLSRTANRSPQASAVGPADSSSMHPPSSALPSRQQIAPGASAEPHGGTVSSIRAPDAEPPLLPMPVEATASVSRIPEFGSIGPHLGLAYALQNSSPRLPQPQLPLKQAQGNSAKPGHHVTAPPQPEANSLCSRNPVEESSEPQLLSPPQAAYVSTAAKSPNRAAYMPMHQPGSLQNGVQETVTAPDLPTEAPIAQQRPGSQPDSMHGQALERAPHPAAHNGLPTGPMQTPRPQGPSGHAPPHAAETAPHAGQTSPSTAASLTPTRPQPSPAKMNGAHRQPPTSRPPPPGFSAWGGPPRPVSGWGGPPRPANGLRQAGLDSHHLNNHQRQSEIRTEQPKSYAAVTVADTYRKQQSAASSQGDEDHSSQQSHLAADDNAVSSGASSQTDMASDCINGGQALGSCQLPKKLAQRAADDDEIPASFCCPITQVSKALGHVLLKPNLTIFCILGASALPGS